jgi:hypothetical protein
MLEDVAIDGERGVPSMKIIRQSQTRFDFVDLTESFGRVVSLAFVRLNADAPAWWIVAAEYSDTWTASELVEVSGLDVVERQRQLAALRSHSNAPKLSGVTYAEVPEGYRQVTPESGPAPNLDRGARYVLHVIGSGFDSVEFEF